MQSYEESQLDCDLFQEVEGEITKLTQGTVSEKECNIIVGGVDVVWSVGVRSPKRRKRGRELEFVLIPFSASKLHVLKDGLEK